MQSKRCTIAILGGMTAAVLGSFSAEAVDGPHNLSRVAPEGQVCITCHTPHHAPSSRLLWNHVLSANNFSWSDWTQTTGGTTLPTNIKTWSGSTKMCLSCHDGTINWGETYHPYAVWYMSRIGGDPDLRTATASGDLKGNHPVAVPYPYNGAKNTYNGITTGDLAVDSGWVATPTKVKLYTDASQAGPNNRGIECASCHDPHNDALGDYLRDSKSGSAICLDCHTK